MCSSINLFGKQQVSYSILSFYVYSTVDNVLKTLRHLNVSKGAGLDKIPAKMLRIAADIIAPSFPLYF
jgi:hypothetical protein